MWIRKQYSPFSILLEDTVCLFRIDVHQSGNVGKSISQTDKSDKDSISKQVSIECSINGTLGFLLLCILVIAKVGADSPWENRKQPVLPLVSKHLSYISVKAQRKSIFVRTIREDRSPKCL